MSEESARVLIKKRGGLKSAITRISCAISDLDQSINRYFVSVRLASLKNLASKYDEIHSKIELKVGESDIAFQDRFEVEELLFSTEARILELLELNQNSTESRPTLANVQLQLIRLPCFTGNILEWHHFSSIFTDIIHSRTDLSTVQKLHYLRSSLKNEPLNFIKSLPICAKNYTVALSLLSDRYSNNVIIAKYYLQNLLNAKSIEKGSAQNLSEAMKIAVNSFKLILAQLLASRLDANTAKLWKESLS